MALVVKNKTNKQKKRLRMQEMQEMQVRSLGPEGPLEEEMAMHSRLLLRSLGVILKA